MARLGLRTRPGFIVRVRVRVYVIGKFTVRLMLGLELVLESDLWCSLVEGLGLVLGQGLGLD
jgi:hypothetical protein